MHTVTESLLPITPTTVYCSSMMWKLSLFILYATALFAFVSADHYFPLNTCVLTVQSTVGKVANPQSLLTYGMPAPPLRAERDA